MMICEQCETELTGATVICKSCGHNNALKKMEIWREKRDLYLESMNVPIAAAAAASSRTYARDAGNLIRFPKSPTNGKVNGAKPETIEPKPEWKEKLHARLREIREQKAAEVEPPTMPSHQRESSRQPIVEAALRRINRANYLAIVPEAPEVSAASTVAVATEVAVNQAPAYQVEALANRAPAMPRAPMVVEPNYLAELDLFADDPIETDTEAFGQEYEELDLLPDEIQFSHHEPTSLEAASLKSRIASAVIDAEIIAFSFLPIIAVYAFLGGESSSVSLTGLLSLTAVLVTVYFFVTYALAGRTIGMAILKLHLASLKPVAEQVQSNATSTISFTFQQAAARAIGGTLSLLLFPVNLICILRNFDRLSVSDYFSGTQVVRIKN